MAQEQIFKRFVTFIFWSVLVLGTIHLWQVIAILTSFQISRLWTDPVFFYLRLFGAIGWTITWFWLAQHLWRNWEKLHSSATRLSWAIGIYTIYQLVYLVLTPASTGNRVWVTILFIGVSAVGLTYLILSRSPSASGQRDEITR